MAGSALALVAGVFPAQAQETIDGGASVTVPGTHSSPWDISGELVVGDTGAGALTVGAGGTVTNTYSHIGRGTGSNGTVTVSGTDALWQNSGNLHVGRQGIGALTVGAGGTVANAHGYIGYFAGGGGTVTVSGTDARWQNSGYLTIGNSGAGDLTIGAGGTVTNTLGRLGYSEDVSGTVTVSGTGARWENSADIQVGIVGTGVLTVGAGGTVTSSRGLIGFGANSNSVTVSGDDALWQNSSYLTVGTGSSGTGALTVGAGGTVTNTDGYIGQGTGSSGTATVSGDDALWQNSGGLAVGRYGAGALTIGEGGTVRVGGGNGTVNIAQYTDSTDSTGRLTIGAAAGDEAVAAGTLEAATVAFGHGTGALVFNHTGNPDGSDHVFAAAITSGLGSATIDQVAGTTILTGDSSGFAGTTSVAGGTLLVENILGGTVTVDAVGTLGGTGTIGGNATVDGTLSAGNSPGTLSVAGDLALGGGSTSVFELNTPGLVGGTGAAGNDLVNVGGDLTLGGTLDARVAAAGYYRLFDYGGTLAGTFAGGTLTGTDGFAPLTPNSADVRYDIPNQVNLSVLGAGQTMQFWDGANTTADGAVDGSAGTWADFGTNWTDSAGNANSGWGNSVGVFAGASGGVVTVDGTQGFDTLQFSTNGYTLTGGTLALSPASGAAGTLNVDNGVSATVGSVIADGTGNSLRKTGGGTLVLSGTNTYSGGTQFLGGTLSVSSDASLGNAAGGLSFDGGALRVTGTGFTETGRMIAWGANGGGFDIADAGNTFTLSQDIVGTGDLIKQGAGTLVLSGDNAFGNTAITAGELIGNTGSISGDIANAGTVTFDQAADASFAGDIGGLSGNDGTMVKQGAGTLMLGGRSALDWTIAMGGVVSAADRFTGDADIASGASLTFDQTTDAAYGGTLSGAGDFITTGSGTVLYDGDGSGFTGNTTIADGRMIIGSVAAHANAVLGGSFEVRDGGTLGGHGSVGGGAGSTVTIASGGTIAPGNSIGTLTVNGDIAFAAGSTYEVEVDPVGTASDLIHATGQARLNGASISHIGLAGAYDPSSTYTILTADGGIDGTFGDVTSVYAFLSPELSYDATSVLLELTRNDMDFAGRAHTFNQNSAAEGAESLGQGNAVYGAIAVLPDDDAVIGAAFDALSGEMHASAKTALIEDSHFVRDAANDRIRAALAGVGTPDAPVLAYVPGNRELAAADTDRFAAWGSVFGAWGSFDGDGNAGGMDTSIRGFLTGIDGAIASNVRLGLLAGYGRSSFDVDDRASSGNSDNYHLGLYGGGRWDALRLSGGLAYTWHDIETSRSVAFPGFADRLSADYDAATFQAFGEAGYRIDAGVASLEPFAGLAYVNLDTDGFDETGGAAALSGAGDTTETTFSTLGLRASTDLPLGAMKANLYGTLGWRHAFGDVVPLAGFAFAGGEAFTVAGVPIAEDTATIEAGLDLDLTGNATLGLSYAGQIASGAQDHGFNAKLSVSF